jgi:glycolate oxidase FAD binding subunit
VSDLAILQERIRGATKVAVFGARTKSVSSVERDSIVQIGLSSFSGVVSYDPQEFVVTVWAGTPLSEITSLLGQQGQYLPFDPLLVDRNATIGGTVASNASGPGRFRFGGIRDFLIGVRFIDGQGNLIRGGGQVVKNAAGFDYPKLMVGSRGTLGAIYELTFKVFPKPESFASAIFEFKDLSSALNTMNQLSCSVMDVEALDLVPVENSSSRYEMAVRIGGIASALPNRLSRLRQFGTISQTLSNDNGTEEAFWREVRNLDWVPKGSVLHKIPITPNTIPTLEPSLSRTGLRRRYSVGGNIAWVVENESSQRIELPPSAQVLVGRATKSNRDPGPFGRAIRRALDPSNKFV